MISVVIPAHDEERSIGRLLTALAEPVGVPGLDVPELDVIIVCNGCSDRTAEVARTFDGVRVVEIAEASKASALTHGDGTANGFPRLYVDADVVLAAADVRAVAAALAAPGILAAAPRRAIPMDGVSAPVRWFYDVWQALPQVRSGLFGRGVIGVSRDGHERIRILPPSTSDDLVFSEAFAQSERVVVDTATVVVHPPRTLADLLRRRVRVILGNQEADTAGLRSSEAQTSVGGLVALARREPRLAPRLPVFVAVSLGGACHGRRRVRRGAARRVAARREQPRLSRYGRQADSWSRRPALVALVLDRGHEGLLGPRPRQPAKRVGHLRGSG